MEQFIFIFQDMCDFEITQRLAHMLATCQNILSSGVAFLVCNLLSARDKQTDRSIMFTTTDVASVTNKKNFTKNIEQDSVTYLVVVVIILQCLAREVQNCSWNYTLT